MPVGDLKELAREIFFDALRAADARKAVREKVALIGDSALEVADQIYTLGAGTKIYAVGVGKASYRMAMAIDEILKGKLEKGVISCVLDEKAEDLSCQLSSKWECFTGGHPLPNEMSLAAAREAIEVLSTADENSIVIFLISGGGSAMFEAPVDDAITLEDLRRTNLSLITCGAEISEINLIRRAISRVKGGKLATFAKRAAQISLIISDTEKADEKSVASGLTFETEAPAPHQVNSILERYNLLEKLPVSVARALREKPSENDFEEKKGTRQFCVLLDNQTVIKAAFDFAESRGLCAAVADHISQQNVGEGCTELFAKIKELSENLSENKIACLISGGEFSCPVRGKGVGGRNLESVLRAAILLDENQTGFTEAAFLSAGTDGIDGNSPAAGAVCDSNTLARARELNLDAGKYLENSDSFTFFQQTNDALVTGATGTNVRDLRLMLMRV